MNENPDQNEPILWQWVFVRVVHVLIGFTLFATAGLVVLALAYYPIKWACGL